MSFTVQLDTGELDRIAAGLHWNVEQVCTQFAFLVQRYAQMLAPADTDALRASIYVKTRDLDGRPEAETGAKGKNKDVEFADEIPTPTDPTIFANVGPCVIYGRIQELGGVVKPVTAKVLRWQSKDGAWHSAHEVHIPAHPYLMPATEQARASFYRGEEWRSLVE